jgi:hypothetical protein
MALVPVTLQQQLSAAFKKQLADKSSKPEVALETLSLDIATAIDAYIRTATVTVTGTNAPGQVIAGAGGGPAPVVGSTTTPGVVTGTGIVS